MPVPIKLTQGPQDPPLVVASRDIQANGAINASGQSISFPIPPGTSAMGFQVTGTWTGTLTFEGSVDGQTFSNLTGASTFRTAATSTTINGIFILAVAGFRFIRIRASAWTSGSAQLWTNATIGPSNLLMGLPGTDPSSLGKAEDQASISGDVGVAMLGVIQDEIPFEGVPGDYQWVGMDLYGGIHIGQVKPGTNASHLGKAEDAAHASGDVGVMALGVLRGSPISSVDTDGDYVPLSMDNTGRLWTVAMSSGDVAHSAADSGNPLKIGAKAIAHGTNPTAVDAAERTDLYANRAGVLFTIGGHPNIVTLELAATAAQTDVAIVTAGAGTKIVTTEIEALCDNANTVDVGVRVGFGAANTPTTTGVVLTHPGIAPGSGVVRGAGSGILGVGADGEDLRVTAETPTGGNLRILVSYHTIDS